MASFVAVFGFLIFCVQIRKYEDVRRERRKGIFSGGTEKVSFLFLQISSSVSVGSTMFLSTPVLPAKYRQPHTLVSQTSCKREIMTRSDNRKIISTSPDSLRGAGLPGGTRTRAFLLERWQSRQFFIRCLSSVSYVRSTPGWIPREQTGERWWSMFIVACGVSWQLLCPL